MFVFTVKYFLVEGDLEYFFYFLYEVGKKEIKERERIRRSM